MDCELNPTADLYSVGLSLPEYWQVVTLLIGLVNCFLDRLFR